MTYDVRVPKCGDVKEMQIKSSARQMELNRRSLVKIVETLVQGIALRGDNSDDDLTSCERHSAINGLDETKAEQIY